MTLDEILKSIGERAEIFNKQRNKKHQSDVTKLLKVIEKLREQRDKYHTVTLLFNDEEKLKRQKEKCDAELLEELEG